MALSVPIPPSPSSGNSPSSTDSPNVPQTPLSPTNPVQTLTLPPPADQTSAQVGQVPNSMTTQTKRKPSRRANTAERRATHNAVERQRRETLNSRFLDLAALLPNLSQIRRPSKSAIVNSSIAHIHASRRHRLLASRELRLVKLESDALRRELNEWRDRANLPRVEEPVRSDAFALILSGEVEVLTAIPGMEEQDEDGADGYGDGEDELPIGAMHNASLGASIQEEVDEMRNPMPIAYAKNASNPFAHNVPSQASAPHLAHILPRPTGQGGPMIAQSITSVSFENPAMASLFDSHSQIIPQQFQLQQYSMSQSDEKVTSWNNQLFAAQQLQQQYGGGTHHLFTPPPSSHGPPSNGTNFGNPAFFNSVQRQQHGMQGTQGTHIFGSAVDEDASSVGSCPLNGRERSGSMGAGSGYGSPPHARGLSANSPSGSYEMPSLLLNSSSSSSGQGVDGFGMPKRMSAGVAMHAWAREDMGAMKPNMTTPPVTVGGGGGTGAAFAMMM
ncbi:hypothetical protein EW146_g6429 [Bondarzewia mesenterica]|uniref:BHLH domain-containing protein n=1 Tax=Bondarzewia mesenterica TaxID=1095465 RepID=A0A4S4LNP1_9AGAM|nr:hypothetical protein EW146_g6429 [Bondarzewia mesenterica]